MKVLFQPGFRRSKMSNLLLPWSLGINDENSNGKKLIIYPKFLGFPRKNSATSWIFVRNPKKMDRNHTISFFGGDDVSKPPTNTKKMCRKQHFC